MPDFDPTKELQELRALKAAQRKGRYYRSRLDRYTAELLALRKAGASAADLQLWLRQHRISVVLSTVTRWLLKHEQKQG